MISDDFVDLSIPFALSPKASCSELVEELTKVLLGFKLLESPPVIF
jgi:hypothetical protein